MSDVFLKVFNLSVSASWLILAVLVVRFLLKRRAPKWVLPLLWGLVALRLICPVSIESALSLLPSGETLSPETVHFDPSPAITSGVAIIDEAVNPVLQERFGVQGVQTASVNPLDVAVFIASVVWLLGMLALLIYALVSTRRLRRRVASALLLRENIYESEFVSSPFVFGLVKPKIYLPSGMDEVTAAHVLAHERAHLVRRDHWWKVLAFVLLTVYWFSPLVWLAYVLLCRDIELACDEKVVRTMDAPQRADYSQSLLSCAVQGRRIAVCPLAFGEGNIKARVKNVLSCKRTSRGAAVLALLVLTVLAVCFLTEPEKDEDRSDPAMDERNETEYEPETGAATVLFKVDLTGDGVNEWICYENIGGGDYRLRILGDEERYSAELSTAHVGWDSYFLYTEGDTNAILHYTPWDGQGFYSCTYELFDFSGGTHRVIAENHVEIDTNENGSGVWSGDAEAFADEVNALLDRSTLIISTLNGKYEIFGGSGAAYHWQVPVEDARETNDVIANAEETASQDEMHSQDAAVVLDHAGWRWYTEGGSFCRAKDGVTETLCTLPENEAGTPVLAELSVVDGRAALSYHVGGATMGHSELLLFNENGERVARYIHGGMIAVSGGIAVSADFSPMPAPNNLSISRDGGESWEKLGDGGYCYGISVTTNGEQRTYTATSVELRDGWAYTTGVYDLDVELGTQSVTQKVRVDLVTGKTEVLD